jgi:hypothetical protein
LRGRVTRILTGHRKVGSGSDQAAVVVPSGKKIAPGGFAQGDDGF